MKKQRSSTYRTVFLAVMAAIVCVVTFFRFPFLGSKVHFANAMCLLSGLLFGDIKSGAAQVNRVASLPMDYVMIIQAMVVVLVAAPRLIDAILKPLRKLAKAKGDKG